VLGAAAAASEGHAGSVMDYVAEDYRGEGGDRDGLRSLITGWVLRSDGVSAIVSNVEPVVSGPTADVTFALVLARVPKGTPAGAVSGESTLGAHKIEAKLRKDGGRWLFIAAKRSGAGPSDFF
jgi:hypothetical protein